MKMTNQKSIVYHLKAECIIKPKKCTVLLELVCNGDVADNDGGCVQILGRYQHLLYRGKHNFFIYYIFLIEQRGWGYVRGTPIWVRADITYQIFNNEVNLRMKI